MFSDIRKIWSNMCIVIHKQIIIITYVTYVCVYMHVHTYIATEYIKSLQCPVDC